MEDDCVVPEIFVLECADRRLDLVGVNVFLEHTEHEGENRELGVDFDKPVITALVGKDYEIGKVRLHETDSREAWRLDARVRRTTKTKRAERLPLRLVPLRETDTPGGGRVYSPFILSLRLCLSFPTLAGMIALVHVRFRPRSRLFDVAATCLIADARTT